MPEMKTRETLLTATQEYKLRKAEVGRTTLRGDMKNKSLQLEIHLYLFHLRQVLIYSFVPSAVFIFFANLFGYFKPTLYLYGRYVKKSSKDHVYVVTYIM